MIKTFLIVLGFFLFGATSCKKNNTGPVSNDYDYYIKFKLDGADKQYADITKAVFTNSSGIYASECIGQKEANGYLFLEGMILSIVSDSVITPNITYTNQTGAEFSYTDSTDGNWASGLTGDISNDITITQLDDKTITGTFSGTMTNLQDLTTTINITEGKFHLPVKH